MFIDQKIQEIGKIFLTDAFNYINVSELSGHKWLQLVPKCKIFFLVFRKNKKENLPTILTFTCF